MTGCCKGNSIPLVRGYIFSSVLRDGLRSTVVYVTQIGNETKNAPINVKNNHYF